MKKISLLLSMIVSINANCQDIAKKLLNKTWYASGDVLKTERVLLYSAKPLNHLPEIKFLEDNNFQLKTDTLSDFTFVCLYQFKKNMVRIFYTERIEPANGPSKEEEVSHYYRISAIQNSSNVELVPVSAADFK